MGYPSSKRFILLPEIQIQLGRLYFMGQAYVGSWSPKALLKCRQVLATRRKKTLLTCWSGLIFQSNLKSETGPEEGSLRVK